MNIVHGGSRARSSTKRSAGRVRSYEKYFVTVELTTRFRKPLPVGVPVTIRAGDETYEPPVRGEGEITGPDGTYIRQRRRSTSSSRTLKRNGTRYLHFRNDD